MQEDCERTSPVFLRLGRALTAWLDGNGRTPTTKSAMFPSCHQKRTLVTAINITENICAPVPHRQFVFTMPKRFRLYFRYNRNLLRKLPRLAWETIREVYQAVLDRGDVTPGMIGGIQTHGQLSQWHPHLH